MAVSNKTITFNILGLLLIKAVSMVVSLATIPILLIYFHNDKEALGTWLAFFTFTAIVLSLDLGIGNRLKNDILSRISSRSEYHDLIEQALASQIAICIAIAIIVTGFGLAVLFTRDNHSEIGRIIHQNPELLAFSAAFILCAMPLRTSYFVLQAQQRNAISALIALTPQLLVLLYATIAIKTTTLPLTIPALATVWLLVNIAVYLAPFAFTHSTSGDTHPSRSDKRQSHSLIFKQIAKLTPGLPFFFVQLSIIFLYSYNELFYLVTGTTVDIVHYQYYFRPFSLFSVGFSILSLPFWSAIRLSQLHKDYKRTQQLIGVILVLNIPIAIALIPTVYFFQDILDVWLGAGSYSASSSMLLFFAVSSQLVCLMHALSSILSAYDLIAFQSKCLGIGLIIKIISLWALTTYGINNDPVMLSTTIGLMFVVVGLASKAIALWRSNLINRDPAL